MFHYRWHKEKLMLCFLNYNKKTPEGQTMGFQEFQAGFLQLECESHLL